MLYHRSLGRDLHKLVIAVVDNRRPMLPVMRAMLAAMGAGRIQTYESPTGAIGTMATASVERLLVDCSPEGFFGRQFTSVGQPLLSL